MKAIDICKLSKGRLKESDIHKIRKLGEQTIVTTKDAIWKIDGGCMTKLSARRIKESAAQFVIVQEGDNDYDEYYLTSKCELTPDPFNKDIKFFSSEEQARSFALKAYVPEFLSEKEFDYAIESGVIELRESDPESLSKELGPIFLEKTGASAPEDDEEEGFEDGDDESLDDEDYEDSSEGSEGFEDEDEEGFEDEDTEEVEESYSRKINRRTLKEDKDTDAIRDSLESFFPNADIDYDDAGFWDVVGVSKADCDKYIEQFEDGVKLTYNASKERGTFEFKNEELPAKKEVEESYSNRRAKMRRLGLI